MLHIWGYGTLIHNLIPWSFYYRRSHLCFTNSCLVACVSLVIDHINWSHSEANKRKYQIFMSNVLTNNDFLIGFTVRLHVLWSTKWAQALLFQFFAMMHSRFLLTEFLVVMIGMPYQYPQTLVGVVTISW